MMDLPKGEGEDDAEDAAGEGDMEGMEGEDGEKSPGEGGELDAIKEEDGEKPEGEENPPAEGEDDLERDPDATLDSV